MNILQEIDATLQYENMEKAWHKYKFVFILAIIALFGGIALFNSYNKNSLATAKADTAMIFDIVRMGADYSIKEPDLKEALAQATNKTAKEYLSLELAKSYKAQGKTEKYEATLMELTNAKVNTISSLSKYMLAELYLQTKPKEVISFIDNQKINKKDFVYPLMQELKAIALTANDKTEEAKKVYNYTLNLSNTTDNQKARLEIRLNQLTSK